ncbi:MAG: glutaredoxin 3 [Halieaceae bacterium]
MYSTRFCPYCIRARRLLQDKGVAFEDIAVDGDRHLRARMEQLSGRGTVPQIWIGERHVGGFDDLWLLQQGGELDRLLQASDLVET